jgi:hypothetical protein
MIAFVYLILKLILIPFEILKIIVKLLTSSGRSRQRVSSTYVSPAKSRYRAPQSYYYGKIVVNGQVMTCYHRHRTPYAAQQCAARARVND